MADPFAQTPAPPANPNASGFMGMSPSFWQNLSNFGANLSVAANARSPEGWLTYGSGLAGPLGAAQIATQKQASDVATAMSGQQLNYAQAAEARSTAMLNELQIPMIQVKTRLYQKLGDEYGVDGGMPPAAADQSQNAPGSEGTGPMGNAIGQIESGGDYSKVNKAGYSGRYQFGTALMQSAGLYTPAQGENIQDNAWGGTINVPGYAPASYSQFMASKPMQDAAFNIAQSYNWDQLKKGGADQYIGENVGGVPITQATLLAGSWIGGPMGMQRFLQTGGRYNPPDSNGTRMSDYMMKTEQLMAQYGMPNTGVAGQTTVATGGAPGMPPQQTQPQPIGTSPDGTPISPAQYSPQAPRPLAPPPQPQQPLAQPPMGGPPPGGAPQQNAPGLNQNFMLPPGIPTIAQDYQKAQYFAQRASMEGMLGLGDAAHADQAQAQYYFDSVKQAMAPQTLRGPGAVGVVPGVGYYSSPIHQNMVDAAGNSLPAVSNPGLNFNGGNLQTPDVQLVPQPGQGSAGQTGPQYITPGATGQGGPYAPGDQVTNNAFDASLLGLPYQPSPSANYQPMTTEINPGLKTNLEEGWKQVNEDQQELDDQAEGAISQNTTLQMMREESKTWTPNAFAPALMSVNNYYSAMKQQLGFDDPNLDAKVGDYKSFVKNFGLLWQDQVRKVSSRASTQEAKMVGDAMPSPTIGGNGLQQILDELQGVNDYTIAKQQAFGTWKASLAHVSPADQVDQLNQRFETQFNQRVRPMAFIVHRMSMTPGGQQVLATMTHNLQSTPEGRAELKSLKQQILYGQQAGLFSNVAEGGP